MHPEKPELLGATDASRCWLGDWALLECRRERERVCVSKRERERTFLLVSQPRCGNRLGEHARELLGVLGSRTEKENGSERERVCV